MALGPAAAAAPGVACAGRSDVLGTARVLPVDIATPRVGRKHFPDTLPLRDKEVVLTFDDGPSPPTTARVLDALRNECVRATFFMLGRMAAKYPDMARRVRAEGHTIAYHTYSHPLLNTLRPDLAMADIDRGIAAVDAAAYGSAGAAPHARFFRFPGFASSPLLLDRLAARGLVVFGADLWVSDWNPMSPAEALHQAMARLQATGGGILLIHDTKQSTAAMLPALLREMKAHGFRVAHVVPKGR